MAKRRDPHLGSESGELDAKPVAVVRPAEPPRGCPISECIALAEAHAKETGYEPALDPDFAADLEEIISSRKPRNISTWESSSTPAYSSLGSVTERVCAKFSKE